MKHPRRIRPKRIHLAGDRVACVHPSRLRPSRNRPLRARRARRAMSAMELVLTTAMLFPIAVALLLLSMRGAKLLYQLISTLIGFPHL